MRTRIIQILSLVIVGFATVASAGAASVDKVEHQVITLWSEGVRLEGDIYKPRGLGN